MPRMGGSTQIGPHRLHGAMLPHTTNPSPLRQKILRLTCFSKHESDGDYGERGKAEEGREAYECPFGYAPNKWYQRDEDTRQASLEEIMKNEQAEAERREAERKILDESRKRTDSTRKQTHGGRGGRKNSNKIKTKQKEKVKEGTH